MTAVHRSELSGRSAPSLSATFRQLSDLYLLSEGGYAPLRGFLNQRETRSVCETMHLTTGEPWSIPVIFPITADAKEHLRRADSVVLMDGNRQAGLLKIEEIFRIDKEQFADRVFRTRHLGHPGVDWLHRAGEYSIAGTVVTDPDWIFDIPGGLPISPRETAALIAAKGWRKVVGFQTRNPMHRAHEFCTKIALELADGLVIHPLLGETKPDDMPVTVRIDCYKALIRNYYSKQRTLLAGFPAWMRYAGPREAIFHAQIRKNYGISHFIVGRDHAGIGDYYGPFDAQQVFSEFLPGELGVKPVFFDFVHYCRACDGMASDKTCPHSSDQHVHLTGKALRQMLSEGHAPPREFTRPEVAEILVAAARGTS